LLDERKIKAIALYVQGIDITAIVKQIGVARATFYNWNNDEEFKAEVSRVRQEYLTQTSHLLHSYGPKAMKTLVYLSEHADSEKVRLEATGKILDKLVSNATKISIDDTREDSTVDKDILDGVMDAEDTDSN